MMPQPGATQPLRLGLVARRLPGPVRRVKVQAQQETLPAAGLAVEGFDRAIAQEVGQVAGGAGCLVAVPQIGFAARVDVRVVVDRAAENSPEPVVAALPWAEGGRQAEVPLPHQRRAIADPARSSDGSVGCAGGRPTSVLPASGSSRPSGSRYWLWPVISANRVAEHTAELA